MVEQVKMPSGSEDVIHHGPQLKSNRFVDPDTILFFFGQLKAKAAAKRHAAKAEAMVRKQFKNAGITLNVYDTVVRLSEQDEVDAVQKFMDEFVHVANAFAVLVGAQLGLFDGPGSAVSAMEKARQSGYRRGLAGDNHDAAAYPENTDLGQEHLAGWHDGQKVLQERFIAFNEQVQQEDAAKKAKADAKANKRAEMEAKKSGGSPPKTEDGDTVQ